MKKANEFVRLMAMPNKTNQNLFSKTGRGFTMVEVMAAVLILSIILSSVMLLINRYLDAVVDMRLQRRAFEVARANMETLLSEDEVSDMSDAGESEDYPDIDWATVIEPFSEPVKNRMWIRAVCSANYTDSKGELQQVELEHWITSLTAEQIKQILNQKDAMGEYYNLIKEGFMTAIQLTTLAFLQSEGMVSEVTEYKEYVEEQRYEKLEYLQANSVDFDQNEFDDYVEELEEAEAIFLEKEIGMDFEKYNEFSLTYELPEMSIGGYSGLYGTGSAGYYGGGGQAAQSNQNNSNSGNNNSDNNYGDGQQSSNSRNQDTNNRSEYSENSNSTDSTQSQNWDWDRIDRSLWPVIEKLTGATPPD